MAAPIPRLAPVTIAAFPLMSGYANATTSVVVLDQVRRQGNTSELAND